MTTLKAITGGDGSLPWVFYLGFQVRTASTIRVFAETQKVVSFIFVAVRASNLSFQSETYFRHLIEWNINIA
jgi:hypothetical protein